MLRVVGLVWSGLVLVSIGRDCSTVVVLVVLAMVAALPLVHSVTGHPSPRQLLPLPLPRPLP